MIEVSNRQIVIDGQPRILICGEIHYFRLPRDQWEDRILKLKEAGGTVVASYIPWLCHEPEPHAFDLDGHSRAELDLGAFIDLCAAHDLLFFARPGPFIMAEMKNEGIPYRVYEDFPALLPMGWDGEPGTSRTLDYLAPDFLGAAREWYSQVIPVIASRLQPVGGNVIAVQLDNEIGMLSWVTNTPDLTPIVLDAFRAWLVERDGDEAVTTRYGAAGEPFARAVRSPGEAIAGVVMRDLGHYMRHRFARYVATLRQYAEEFGVSGVPFVINIHGTEAGGGETFPIGISQLFESYTQSPGYLAGSDHYLGDLTAANAPDLYVMNAFMAAVSRPEQPLTSVEFEAGEGDYGQRLETRLDPSAADFKLRMSIVQGNRLINYYLFTGGFNYRMDQVHGDGNDRISFTGERHGTNAPISPEGAINYTLPRLARTNHMLNALADHLAVAEEEHDPIAMGFIPDYWMTESHYPRSAQMTDIVESLKRCRFGGPAGATARALMHLGWRYPAVDIQHCELDVATTPVLVVACARYMAREVQDRLVTWLQEGGRLLLHGEVPSFDMTGERCTVLQDALGLRPLGMRWSDHRTFCSVNPDGWLAPAPELRVGWAQGFAPLEGRTILRLYPGNEACGFDIPVGAGRAIVITAEIPTDPGLFGAILTELAGAPGLRHDHPLHGIFLGSATTPAGARFVHALNFDGVDKVVHLFDAEQPLCDGRPITLRRRDGVMLPVNLRIGRATVEWSTAEIVACDTTSVTLRLTGEQDAIALRGVDQVTTSIDSVSTPYDGGMLIESLVAGTGDERMTVCWT